MLRDWTDSDRFDGITAEAERAFCRLIMKADDYGRFHAEPRRLKAALFPLLENLRTNDLERWLIELSNRQLIFRYEAEGRQLLAIPRFGQRLKQSRAKFPPPAGKPPDWLPDEGDFPEVPGSSRKFPSDLEEKRRDIEADNDSDSDGRNGSPRRRGPSAVAAATSDAEWLAGLVADPAYKGIDVPTQHARLLRWCAENKKQPSRRRFIAWLNRTDVPLLINGSLTPTQPPDGKKSWE